MARIEASGLVPVGRETVFAFLAELGNHWRLADRWIEVVSLDGDSGGVVRMRGPLGLRRTARTRVLAARPPESLEGEAVLGATRARVCWRLEPDGAGTRVTLSAEVLESGRLDRVLLAAGGRLWMRRRLGATLRRLSLGAAARGSSALSAAPA
jgi:hypothetical protein